MHFKPHSPNYKNSSKHPTQPVKIDDNEIPYVKETKFLGVIIDDELSWSPHIKNLTNRLKYHIGSINRIKDNIPSCLHKSLYHTLFESHLLYGITVWGGVSKSKLEPLLKAQKKCLRILFGDKEAYLDKFKTCARVRPPTSLILGDEFFRKEESKPLFNLHEIFTVHNAYICHLSIAAFKTLKYSLIHLRIVYNVKPERNAKFPNQRTVL